jgi:hypothetical protein
MTERERSRPERTQVQTESSNTDENSGLESTRSQADQLLQAADAAIERALSGDSEQFLHATRQASGQ